MIVTLLHRASAVVVTMLVAAAGADAPVSPQPLPVDCPAVLSAAAAPPPAWSATTAHGIHRFDRSAVIEVPAAPTALTVELWGAGGGGGGGSEDTFTEAGAGGGGGASGGYARGTFAVSSASRYTVVVGLAGEGGTVHADGRGGGASAICENGKALLFAAGGPGGAGTVSNNDGGAGGKWERRAVENPLLDGGWQHDGHNGHRGSAPLFAWRGLGGHGGAPVRGTIELSASQGGDGGAGAMRPDPAQRGHAGGDGAVVIAW
jgi:hypothetical protein